MNNDFYKFLPQSLVNKLNRPCRECNELLGKKDIVAAGIRQDGETYTFFMEILCTNTNCNYRFITYANSLSNMNLKDLCFMILNQIKNIEALETSTRINKKNINKNINKSPFTDKEVKKFLNTMYTSKSYEEFISTVSGNNDKKNKKNKNPNTKPKKPKKRKDK